VDLVITMVYINNDVNEAFFSLDIYIYIYTLISLMQLLC
jgi:hypothetical protein